MTIHHENSDAQQKLQDILQNSASLFDDEAQMEICRAMVRDLETNEERETAARTSYAYLKVSLVQKDKEASTESSSLPTEEFAMRMARRHLIAENLNQALALQKMKEAIQFRQEVRLDEIRTCFDKDVSSIDLELQKKTQEQIRNELQIAPMFVRGYDKLDNAILIKYQRGKGVFDPDAYMNSHLYMAERAMACTERRSCGKSERVVAVLNYGSYASGNLPPIRFLKTFLGTMQAHYPERLGKLVLVDAPFFLRGVWAILSAVMDPVTVDKVKFVSGEAQKKKVLPSLISNDQAMPFMMPDGKLTSEVKDEKLLTEVPHDLCYDEV